MSRARETANFDPSLLADDEVSLDKLGTSGTLDVSSATLTTSTAQKEAIVQAGPGIGTIDVSSGTFTTSTAQKQAIVQAGPGSGTFDVSSGTFTTSTAQKQAIVQAGPGSGTFDVSSGTFTTSTAQKQAIVSGAGTTEVKGLVPVGSIFQMAFTPDATWLSTNGYLICDGSPVSKTTYSALFTALGADAWGTDTATDFYLPDLAGAFLRGKGTGTIGGVNKVGGTNVGDFQVDQMQRHTGGFSAASPGHMGNVSIFEGVSSPQVSGTTGMVAGASQGSSQRFQNTSGAAAHGYARINLDVGDGDETRPYNATVEFIIKF